VEKGSKAKERQGLSAQSKTVKSRFNVIVGKSEKKDRMIGWGPRETKTEKGGKQATRKKVLQVESVEEKEAFTGGQSKKAGEI